MMKINLKYLLVLLTLIVTGCITQKESTIVGGEYNESKNQTDYFVLPFGSVNIPGKWEKTYYTSDSRQQFFTNKDSVSIAIAFERYDNFSFNTDGSVKGYDFVKTFYEWDSRYLVESYGLNRNLIEKDSIKKYIIYRIYGKTDLKEFNTYFLVGEKSGNVSNFSISYTDKWTENEKIEFLRKLYTAKNE